MPEINPERTPNRTPGHSAGSAVRVREENPTLASLFAAASQRFSDRTALTLGTASTSYRELDEASVRVAAGLATHGVGPGTVVALCLQRTFAMVVAMLGVIRAGAAYLPLDPSFPAARQLETLADAKPMLLITEPALQPIFAGAVTPAILLEDLAKCQDRAPEPPITSDDLAYIIYTSGSTGRPKGVQVTHGNVVRLFSSTAPWFGFNEHDVWTMFHSFAFDFSVWEMWGSLLHGGRLVLVPYALSRSPESFLELLRAERVTVLNQTPSAFQMLSRAEACAPRALGLRLVILGGEALIPRTLLSWFDRHGDTEPRLINMYGITETTVHVTCRRMTRADAISESESLIGEPIPDLTLHLLDEQMRPVAPGAMGEMYIGGAGVARGYMNRPELTAKCFLPDRFLPDPARAADAWLYRSGDLARRRVDGELVYLGRADRQVKISGFRIELGEVEAAVRDCQGIAEACVIARPDEDGSQRLIAYYVLNDAGLRDDLDRAQVSRAVAERLPAHMRPALFRALPALPLTVNGKLDQTALPEPATSATASAAALTGTASEQLIADLWAGVLGTPVTSLDDNFFDVGGTSLRLIALRIALAERLGRDIPVMLLFEHTTVRTLAAALDGPSAARPVSSHTASAQENARRRRAALERLRAAHTVNQLPKPDRSVGP